MEQPSKRHMGPSIPGDLFRRDKHCVWLWPLLLVVGCSKLYYTAEVNGRAVAMAVNTPRRAFPTPDAYAWKLHPPWREISRISSPDGKVDAVLVTRPDSDPPIYLGPDPTDLRLVPKAQVISRDPMAHTLSSQEEIDRQRLKYSFRAYAGQGFSVKWDGNEVVRVSGKCETTRGKKDFFDVPLGPNVTRRIRLLYSVVETSPY